MRHSGFSDPCRSHQRNDLSGGIDISRRTFKQRNFFDSPDKG
jgi:hypothetical protein